MQSDDKTQNIFTFLVILSFVVGILVACTSLGSTYGQLQTLDELAKQSSNQNAAIPVGRHPIDIGVDGSQDKVYVSNSGDNTVSVINALNNADIGTIKVGNYPAAIGVDTFRNKVYVVNDEDNTVYVINSASNMNTPMETIKVGSEPTAIGVDDIQGKVYVANQGDNTVSVINSTSKANTTIGSIKVGSNITAIGVDSAQGEVYVANQGDNTVSVINSTTDTEIGTINVGASPRAIGVDTNLNKVYVANYEDKAVSVISSLNSSKIGTINVGASPRAIGVDNKEVYVANYNDNTVSVIDGATDKVVAAVTFTVNPFNAGHIECGKNRLIAPVAQQFYLWSSSGCTAKPNQGFDFVSWQENLGNSSRALQFATPTPFYEPILDFFHLAPDKPEATLNVTKFGSFSANFIATPPPIPPEYVATLFTVVITAFVGTWLAPTIIGWRKTRKEGNRLNDYRNEIKKLYNDGKLDMNDIQALNTLRDNIKDQYLRGYINKEQYDKLADEISTSYDDIFTKEIDSLNKLPGNDKVKQLSATIRSIEDMRASLKKETSILYHELFKEKISSLNSLLGHDKGKLLDDISDAYSGGKISELHYSLLKEKLSNYEKPRG